MKELKRIAIPLMYKLKSENFLVNQNWNIFIIMLILCRYFFQVIINMGPNLFRFGSMKIFQNSHLSVEI